MSKPADDTLFDARVLQHRLRRGEIDPDEYAAHLASLPDEADEGVETDVRFATPYRDRHYVDGRPVSEASPEE